MDNFYSLQAQLPSKSVYNFNVLKDKVVLIVNTATKCGFTPQLTGLEALYQKYQDQGLIILGFPCDQFGHQNPEDGDVTSQVCQINYGVTFPMMTKIEVNGKNTDPVFQYLKAHLGGFLGSRIKWNFTKFLINKQGKAIKRYAPFVKPEALEKDILALL